MKPGYEPKDLGQAISYLIEEAGGTIAAAGKSLRWGLLSVNPELPVAEQETNVAWLVREMRDLERSIRILRVGLRHCARADDFSFDVPLPKEPVVRGRPVPPHGSGPAYYETEESSDG